MIDTCEVSFGVFVGEGSRENEAGMSPNDIETRRPWDRGCPAWCGLHIDRRLALDRQDHAPDLNPSALRLWLSFIQ